MSEISLPTTENDRSVDAFILGHLQVLNETVLRKSMFTGNSTVHADNYLLQCTLYSCPPPLIRLYVRVDAQTLLVDSIAAEHAVAVSADADDVISGQQRHRRQMQGRRRRKF